MNFCKNLSGNYCSFIEFNNIWLIIDKFFQTVEGFVEMTLSVSKCLQGNLSFAVIYPKFKSPIRLGNRLTPPLIYQVVHKDFD